MRKKRIPPLISDLVQTTLVSCAGVVFDQYGLCPQCNGGLSGYDVKKKKFAVVTEGNHQKTVHVLVKRFHCQRCGLVSPARQPFYPETRIGSPVVDLCITLSETMPYSRVATCLAEMGVIVDRWSVRNYVKKNGRTIPSADVFGFRVPLSIVSLSTLAMGMPEGGRIDGAALLAACGNPWVKEPSADSPRGT